MLIEAAHGEAEIAAFDLDLDRGTPAGGAASPLDRAVTAGLATPCVSVFVRALALLLAAGWLAGLFRAVLPWSLTAYLAAAAVAAAVMIGRRNRRGHAHVGPRGCRWRR